MLFKSLVLFSAVLGVSLAELCPPNACDTVRCNMDVAFGCTEGRVDPRGGYCGCCPACIKQLKEGESCLDSILLGAPRTSECGDGLQCDLDSKTCKNLLNPCHKELADKQQQLDQATGPIMGMSMPTCDEKGFYAAKQCVEAVCQCVKADGTPIQGYSVSVSRSSEMTCQCARDKAVMAEKPLLGQPKPQCDRLGNYIKRQCHDGTCVCVDRNGKTIAGYQTEVANAPKMGCDCARQNSDMILNGENRIPYKCDALGNFA